MQHYFGSNWLNTSSTLTWIFGFVFRGMKQIVPSYNHSVGQLLNSILFSIQRRQQWMKSAAVKRVKGSIKSVRLAESLFPQLWDVCKILAPPLLRLLLESHQVAGLSVACLLWRAIWDSRSYFLSTQKSPLIPAWFVINPKVTTDV